MVTRTLRSVTLHIHFLSRYFYLSHYATNRQVADSIPDGVIGIFQ